VRIWNWVVAAYGRPGVADACLRLQDEHGQSTSLLLWAVWSGVSEPGTLARAAELVRSWEAQALIPLRTARRALKAPQPPVGDSAREALRATVKDCELQAERLLLETLAAAFPQTRTATPLAALQAAAAAAGAPVPPPLLAALARALV